MTVRRGPRLVFWTQRLAGLTLAAGMVACGGSELALGSDSQANAAKATGLVAVGGPVVGAAVEIVCAGGTPQTTSSGSDGSFAVSFAQQTLPCAVRASAGTVDGVANTQTLYSALYTAGRVNVTPLTDLLLTRLAAEAPAAFYDGFTSGGRSSKVNTTTIAAATSELLQYLSALGIDTTSISGLNLITDSFRPSAGDSHDAVLEALAKRLSANAMSLDDARSAMVSFTLPGPCSDASGLCWPLSSYKLLAEGRANEKGEPEAKFHEHDVDIAVGADGNWTKTITLKADKAIVNYDIDIVGRGLAFTGKYQSTNAGNCGYAVPAGESCYEAVYASMVMICGAGSGDDFVLMPYATVQKDSSAELKKESATPLYGQTFDRIVGCTKAASVFRIDASGQVTDETGASLGAITSNIGKNSAKTLERKFWTVSSGTLTKYVGIETGSKNGQPYFVVLVSQ